MCVRVRILCAQVCVCMCACVRVCVHGHAPWTTRTHTHSHERVCTRAWARTLDNTHMHAHKRVYACMGAHLGHVRREAHGTGALAGGVDAARRQRVHVAQQLRLGHRGVAHLCARGGGMCQRRGRQLGDVTRLMERVPVEGGWLRRARVRGGAGGCVGRRHQGFMHAKARRAAVQGEQQEDKGCARAGKARH